MKKWCQTKIKFDMFADQDSGNSPFSFPKSAKRGTCRLGLARAPVVPLIQGKLDLCMKGLLGERCQVCSGVLEIARQRKVERTR